MLDARPLPQHDRAAMTQTTPREIVEPAPDKQEKPEDWKSFGWFLVKLVIIVLVFRTLVFTSFNIPSESMMPRLLVGDYLFAAKWPYGYSTNSLPFGIDIGDGKIFASQPDRGDIVIFKHPVDKSDYIKRVIGLPGDRVQMIDGALHLNGKPVERERIDDLVIAPGPSGRCHPSEWLNAQVAERGPKGSIHCRFTQYRETLPGGTSYNVIDTGLTEGDTMAREEIVPEGHLFLMGDHRDNSLDSRFPALAGKGVGLVPQQNLVAEASFMYWSWGDGPRFSRIGRGI